MDLHINLLISLLVSLWTPSLWYSTILYLPSSNLWSLFFLYLPISSYSLVASSTLLLLPHVSFSFSPQTLLPFLLFLSFLYLPPFSILFCSLPWKAKPWLLCEPCCLLQTLPMPTTPANLSAYDPQRTSSTVPTLGSSILSAHPSGGGMPLTTSSLSQTLFSLYLHN